jgi:cell division transport system permease protein
MRALRYAFDEASASLWRGRQSGLLSTGTIAVALIVLGGFLLATSNLQRLGDEWSRAAEMSVYLHDQATPADRAVLEGLLKPGGVVASVEFVSKAEALERFKRTFPDLASTVSMLDENPMPASYEVRLQPKNEATAAVDDLASTLRAASGVTDVRYDRQWLDRLLSVVAMVRLAGVVLGAVLILAAALTVATVVRLALHAREDEIEIMRLVGAPQVYIRGPFVMEGVLQGGIGAAIALGVMAAVFLAVRGRYLVPLAEAVNFSSVRFLSPGFCVLLLGGGMVVGCLGGLLASRQTRSLKNLDTQFKAALNCYIVDVSPRGICMPRFVMDSRPISAQQPITEFYRQEFIKHHQCLQQHRPYFSEGAITDVEAALARIMGELESMCSKDNVDELVSSLLKKIDVVTGLSSWSDPRHTH